MASSVVFKVKYEDTLRRFNVLVNGDQSFDLNMEGLKLKICSLFDLASSTNFSLVYTDEDNDLITLGNDEDLSDVLKQGLNPVRITVCLKKDKDTKTSASSSGNSEQKLNPSVSEVLKSVPEPLLQAISKISTEVTSKAASTSPVLGDLLNGLSKMGQSYLNPSSVETRDDLKHKASSEEKFKDIPSSSSLQQSTKSTQDMRESDFIDPFLSNLQFGEENLTSEPTKKYREDYYKMLSKSRGCRVPNSSKVGLKKRVSFEKDAGKSAALGYTRGLISGRMPYYPAGGECPFSGMSPFLGYSGFSGKEKVIYDNAPPSQKLYDSSYNKVDGMGPIFHKGVRCDGCGVLPITGPRYKSKVKHDYDLCRICFGRMGNESDFTRIDFPLPYPHPWVLKDLYDPALQHPLVIPPRMTKQHGGKQPRSKLDSRFITDVNVMDGTMMAPSTPFTKIWRMRNNGTLTWQSGIQLLWIGGDRFSSSDSVEIQVPVDGVNVGKEIDIAVDFIAPELPGHYVSYWRMAEPSGQKFGQRVWVSIQVDPSVDLTLESTPALNLNLPPEATFNPQFVDENKPELNIEAPLSQPSVVDRRSKLELEDLNFPINDDLLVTTDVLGSSSSMGPSVIPNNGVIPESSSSVDNGSHDLPPSASLKPLYPVIGMNDGSSASSSGSKNDDPSSVDQDHGKEGVEETLLRELEDMGFKQIDLNKEVLRGNEYDLERSVDELCSVSEWDPILEELKEMGFEDKETNKKLLEKNNGSITRVVMDLIAGEKP